MLQSVNMGCLSIYLCCLHFLSAMFYSFQCSDLSFPWLSLSLFYYFWYYCKWDCSINFFYRLVNRNTASFCILIFISCNFTEFIYYFCFLRFWCHFFNDYFCILFFLIEVWLLYSVVLVYAAQQHGSAICIHIPLSSSVSLPPTHPTLLGHHRARRWAPYARQQFPTSCLFYPW